jgi:ABC-type transporter Mla subunit MlaD
MTISSKSTIKKKPVLKIKSMTLTIEKTIQVVKFEPVSVRLSQTVDIEEGDARREIRKLLYKDTSNSVNVMMGQELELWRKDHGLDTGEE